MRWVGGDVGLGFEEEGGTGRRGGVEGGMGEGEDGGLARAMAQKGQVGWSGGGGGIWFWGALHGCSLKVHLFWHELGYTTSLELENWGWIISPHTTDFKS